jgi:hypothetical protein
VFSGPAGWNFQIVAGGNGQILQAFQGGPVGVQGDYNNNGVVDAADYVLWRKNPAGNGGAPAGYNTWRQNFGGALGSGGNLATGAVPEPTAMLLLTIAAALRLGEVRTGRRARGR